MTSKLTLTVNKAVIDRAKSYAKNTGRSLSELIQSYLENITSNHESGTLSPRLTKIVGSVKLPDNFDEDEVLRSYLEEKHR